MSLDISKYRIPRDLEKYRKDLIPFAYNELEPLAEKADELDKMDKRLLPLMSKAGLLSLPYPKEYGGYSLPYSQWYRLLEIPAGVGGVVRGFTHMGTAIWRMLYFHGTKEQKERYLRPIVGGKTIGGFAFTEPDTGTGVDIKTTDEKRGGSYVLNGTKHLISNSDIA
ncbi:MAG: acyl-CoA dehydrogenase family protein, partial [Chloroflexi bacterium]|nr:acyl-CoA dehydrogenase family protein [Chloroflexota bacterium]